MPAFGEVAFYLSQWAYTQPPPQVPSMPLFGYQNMLQCLDFILHL